MRTVLSHFLPFHSGFKNRHRELNSSVVALELHIHLELAICDRQEFSPRCRQTLHIFLAGVSIKTHMICDFIQSEFVVVIEQV